MQIVIDIPESIYETIKEEEVGNVVYKAIKNGTPLEKHDEEVIKETVESIWGKPPYTEMLDKIKTEIENTEIVGHIRDVECFNAGINVALNVIDKYMAESEDIAT